MANWLHLFLIIHTAEPSRNGTSDTILPFPNISANFVVSCHLQEHVPVIVKDVFLDQLISKSKRNAILINPLQIE